MTGNPHSSSEARRIALENTVLRGEYGSSVHGVSTGAADRDEMGVCIEPPTHVIGISAFEQYQYRTRPTGVRSGPGDLDLTIYSLRKWARLAAQGNPTILLLMFLPPHDLAVTSDIGADIQAHPERFISRQAAARFAGYLVRQRDQLLGRKSKKHTNRPELVDVCGFDTKFAYHMVRLGLQGVELLTAGRITLPIPEPDRTWLAELRRGEHTQEQALDRATELLTRLDELAESSDLPPHPDRAAIDRWLTDTYESWWHRKAS
ncbi:DNA polymerase beta superfamily protein [Nocardia puris]|uniref:Putative nucleotidyltransferase n=1 Tax=Nocardia puris TaxID=208602 RepID=A0A366DAG6_9NOCA|nr:nucleotidyltransferase domain-containing protein [Nocardia puris]RBO87051.1 putative nucleotidyltransferase [Nocardia puris]